MEGVEVRVRLVTAIERFRVGDEPLSVPAVLTSSGLSEVVNHLLGLESSPTAFDFLYKGQFLRGSVAAAVADAGDSLESVAEIEYVPALRAPERRSEQELPHPVGAVAAAPRRVIASARVRSGAVYAGLYDGGVRVLDGGSVLGTTSVHRKPVRALALVGDVLVSGGMDQVVRLSQGAGLAVLAELRAHEASVTSLEARGGRIASGDWAGSLYLCSAPEARAAPKRARAPTDAQELMPSLELSGHSQAVSGLAFVSDSALASCSWDNTVRQWDLVRGAAVHEMTAGKVATSLVAAPALLATAHADGCVRLWDTRADAPLVGRVVVGASWAAQLAWRPGSESTFACASYDGSVALLDVRAREPVHVTPAVDGKALCLAWAGPNRLAVGSDLGKVALLDVQ